MAEVLMGALIFSLVLVTALMVFRHSFLLAKHMEERILILNDSSFPRYLIGNFLQFTPQKVRLIENRVYFEDYRMMFVTRRMYRTLTNDQHQPILVYDSPLYHNYIQASWPGDNPVTEEDGLFSLDYDVSVTNYSGPLSLGLGRFSDEKTMYTVHMKFLPLYKYYGLPDRKEKY